MKRLLAVAVISAPLWAAPTLEEGYRDMYNLDFAAAHRTFADYAKVNPGDPMAPASDAAAYLFSEFDRLHILQSEFFTHDQHFMTDHKLTPDPETKRLFDAALDRSAKLASRSPEDSNSMFALVMGDGLRSDYLALIEKSYLTSLREMKEGRELAEKLLARHPDYADAWLAIGVENYMLSLKAAPLRLFLRMSGAQTDRDTGLARLRITAEKGRYLAPFARLMLGVAAMREGKSEQAAATLRDLVREYPRNPLYAMELSRLEHKEARP